MKDSTTIVLAGIIFHFTEESLNFLKNKMVETKMVSNNKILFQNMFEDGQENILADFLIEFQKKDIIEVDLLRKFYSKSEV